MKKYFKLFWFVNIFTSITSSYSNKCKLFIVFSFCILWSGTGKASDFRLKEYIRAENAPASYTLALLDKSMVVCNLNDNKVPTEISSFIHPSAADGFNRSLRVERFLAKDSYPEHFVVQLTHRKSILRSAYLTAALFKEEESPEGTNCENEFTALDDEENDEVDNYDFYSGAENDNEDEELEYSASMVLFPVEGDPDKMLVYLLGNWSSLLNTTAIFPLFGLKTVTSIGVASTAECADQELSNIKEIGKGTLRQPKPMRGTEKQQKGLSRIRDFEIDPASNGLERVRLKPVAGWGRALLEGDDLFKFRLNSRDKKPVKKGTNKIVQKSFGHRQAMYDVAKEIYNVYETQSIHKDFLPYLDEPVTGGIVGSLNKKLEENWHHYFNRDKLLYVHWTFWFRARKEPDVSSILKEIREKGYFGRIEVGGQTCKTTQLVRSLPIPFRLELSRGADYYWFDRGRWFRIPASRFEVIKKRIADITVKHDELFLPNYEFNSNAEDYKELAYNKAAVLNMREQIGLGKPVLEAILLDRENISLGGRDDKFEFADILMQRADGHYFLIHVKRELAREIDHHRTQAERCALFLGENFDRGALPGLLIIDILRDFYNTHITLPKKQKVNPKTGDVKEVDQEWCSTFKDKISTTRKKVDVEKGVGAKRKRAENFLDIVKDHILNVRTKERLFIRNIVTSKLLESVIASFEPYEDALCCCLDALEDFILNGSKNPVTNAEKESPIVRLDRIEFVKNFLERVLVFLEKHASLVRNHEGVLPQKERENITIVLAVIGDGSGKSDFHYQQLWGMDQTRKLIEKQGFGFNVAFIKDMTGTTEDSNQDEKEDVQTIDDYDDSYTELNSTLDLSTVDKDAWESSKQKAMEIYGSNVGVKGVSNDIMCDDDGQKYVRILIDGSRGDCCFHALGLERGKTIEQICAYVDECEAELLQAEIASRVDQSLKLRHLSDPVVTTAKSKDRESLRGHDLLGWKNQIISGISPPENVLEQLNHAFDRMIKQQGVEIIDWNQILSESMIVRNIVYGYTADVEKLIYYKEFIEKCVADLWKRVSDNQVLKAIENHLMYVGVLDAKGDILRTMTGADLDFSALKMAKNNELKDIQKKRPKEADQKAEKERRMLLLKTDLSNLEVLIKKSINAKQKNYINYKLEVLRASAERKKEILTDFYDTNREWLDPSAIMHLGSRFGFKAKLFKKEHTSHLLRLDAQTQDGADIASELPYRLMVHVNDNHYDLLYPLNVDDILCGSVGSVTDI